ncbi:hypothetical protein EG857_14985, partial [Enterococcus faecalis]
MQPRRAVEPEQNVHGQGALERLRGDRPGIVRVEGHDGSAGSARLCAPPRARPPLTHVQDDDYRESAGDARHGVAGEAPQPQEGVQQRGREPRGRRVRGLAHEGGGRVSGHGREDGWADGRAGRG